MNQENYKKIAEIIDKCYTPTTEAKQTKTNIVKKLADYFENEDIAHKDLNVLGVGKERIFNRTEFLRLCGVE